MDEPLTQTDEPVPVTHHKRRIPIWGRIVLCLLPIIAVGIATYMVLTPFIVSRFYPQYSVLASYSNVMTCTDIAADAVGTYTPMCNDVAASTTSHMIGCIYRDSSTYLPPATASADQQLVCPKLLSTVMPDGQSAPGLTRFAMTEQELRVFYTLVITGSFTALYVITILAVVLSKRRLNVR
jgi:hypothetical protein